MKYIIILSVLLIATLSIYFTFNNSPVKLDKYTCDESGICAEGLEYTVDNTTFIINKNTCLEHNKQWKEDIKACYMN